MSGLAAPRWAPLHFALLGFVLFAGSRWLAPDGAGGATADTRIVVTRDQVDRWLRQYEAVTGEAAGDAVRDGFIARHVEEEMLCREARAWGLAAGNQAIDLRLRQKMAFVADTDTAGEDLVAQAEALGLDADDAVIRNMLAHNMRLLLARTGEQEPTDAEVEAFYAANRGRFAAPPRYSGRQVRFATDRRGAEALAAAQALRRRIEAEGLGADAVAGLGDGGLLEERFRGLQRHQLAARFGEAFAAAVEAQAPGGWTEPVTTPFGVHLVYVEARSEPEVPPLAAIRARVAAVYRTELREARLAAALETLRARYEVVVE